VASHSPRKPPPSLDRNFHYSAVRLHAYASHGIASVRTLWGAPSRTKEPGRRDYIGQTTSRVETSERGFR